MVQAQETPKALRLRLKLSVTAAAAGAGIAPNTYRLGEIQREALSLESKLKFDAYVESLRSRVAKEAA